MNATREDSVDDRSTFCVTALMALFRSRLTVLDEVDANRHAKCVTRRVVALTITLDVSRCASGHTTSVMDCITPHEPDVFRAEFRTA